MDLKYGSTSFSLDLPPPRLAGVIQSSFPVSSTSPEEIISNALHNCQDLISSFKPGEKVVIVTSDITRYTGSEIYLPLLLERLNEQGILDRDIEILIALGIHRSQTPHEHEKILGSLYGRIRVRDHDCDDRDGLVSIGRTASGIDVRINRQAAEADRLILTGVIGFHYFAGFGGGRKSILPGIASRQACMDSHFTLLNPEPGSGKNLQAVTGNLVGNPVHQAMTEACALAAPVFILNTVLNPDKRIIAAFAGHWREAHDAGCRYYREHFSLRLQAQTELVIVSCGGFPKDINLIQAHKSMEYASKALKEGGVMILLAECRDGFGNSGFFNWFRHGSLDVFEATLREHYEINGQTAYSLFEKTRRFTIILVSEFHDAQSKAMGMIPAAGLDEALRIAQEKLTHNWTALVLPDGGCVLPVADK